MSTDPSNAYELLGVSQDARDEEINKAFRQRSLKVHPDRNPDNPEASAKFHELKLAQELLTDPLRRAELDASLRKQRAYKEKYARFDAKRKAMQDDLEEREREFKRAKMDTVKEQREREEKEAYIRDQGRRMREEREKAALAKDHATQRVPESKPAATESQEIDSADLAVRVKFTTTLRPDLSTPAALVALLRPFGALDEDSVLLSIKPPKKHPTKPPKFATALVTFQKIQGAFGAIGASGQKARGLENVDIAWAKGVEPDVVQRLRHQGGSVHSLNESSVFQADRATVSGSGGQGGRTLPSAVPESSLDAPSLEELEMQTLLQLRQAERERLERQKREQELKTNPP